MSRNSTEKRSSPIYTTDTTWKEVRTSSSLNLMKWKNLPSIDVIHKVRELVNKLAKVADVKRVWAVAPRLPDLHHIDFELELPSGTELSDEAWNLVQDLVIDYEWNLRDVSREKWYFDAQVVYRFPEATKVIADSNDKQRAWSSPPLKLVVH
ncbi:hypothetical protein [Iningainema tapete]|uniref:Uncharacterized protein n=1 Tax=Iningainema tapete BLCC-T55 TaxID=2748662 RepID=A0A8J6XGF9_9CYAN|nr:hypothetical protein [Iningainema tapete]MBD2775419.1 hypothetical protein [Iningainema tapete BLCC-T55]